MWAEKAYDFQKMIGLFSAVFLWVFFFFGPFSRSVFRYLLETLFRVFILMFVAL